jgi:hypothetical protein
MPRTRTALLLLAPLLVAGAGCGGGDTATRAVTATTATKTAASPSFDRQIADAGVLRLSDVPAGWKAERQPKDDPMTCPAVKRARTTLSARARSPEFGDPQEREFTQTAVYVYRDAATAHRAWVGLSSPTTRSCLAALFARGLKQGLAASAGSATVVGTPADVAVRTAPLGDERAAGRITIPITVKGSTVDTTVDVIFVRSGRGIASNTFIGVGPLFDGQLEYTLHKLVVDRMNAGLAS